MSTAKSIAAILDELIDSVLTNTEVPAWNAETDKALGDLSFIFGFCVGRMKAKGITKDRMLVYVDWLWDNPSSYVDRTVDMSALALLVVALILVGLSIGHGE
jgi:hypothetical protein